MSRSPLQRFITLNNNTVLLTLGSKVYKYLLYFSIFIPLFMINDFMRCLFHSTDVA